MLAQSEKPDMIVYALDRIVGLEHTDILYKMPVDFNPEEYFASIIGVSDAHKKPKFVTIRVNSWQSNYFRSLPLHSSQQETECTDEYSIFKYYLVPNYEFKQELRSHGSAVQVLEPQKLADEIKKESEEIINLYTKPL